MMTYPADATEAALDAQALALDRGADGETAFLAALAAFDAAMLAHGWKRVRVDDPPPGAVVLTDEECADLEDAMINPRPASEAAKRGAALIEELFGKKADAAPEVKP